MPTNARLGVRYETTDITSTSAIAIPTGLTWTANNDFSVARSTTIQPYSEKADYDHVLPSVDFDIGLTDTLKGRVSYSKTIARAEYGNLYAGASVNGATGSVLIDPTTQASATANNPALVPLESDNIDLSLEWYFSKSGYLAATFWEKRVNNFIGTAVLDQNLYGIRDQTSGPDAQSALAFLNGAVCRGQVTAAGNDVAAACSANDTALFTAVAMLRNAGATGGLAAYNGSSAQILDMENRFDITATAADPLYQFAVQRPVNQESAKIHGWELGGQYFLGETGIGVQANYTIVAGDVGFDDTALGTAQFALLGLSDTANFVLMYEKYGISARLAYNWRDEFLAATNQNGSNRNPVYVEAYQQIDLSVGYAFGDTLQGLSLQFEAINLTGEDVRWHARSTKQMVRLEDQSPRYMLGARYRF
jgi:TonB-dependent receptor